MPDTVVTDGYVYGWGRTKHIKDPDSAKRNAYRTYRNEEVGLCGAYGGNTPNPKRPVCKTCLRMADRPPLVEVIQKAIDHWRIGYDSADDHGPTMAEFIVASLMDDGRVAL